MKMLAAVLLVGVIAPYPTSASQAEPPLRSPVPIQAALDLDECQIAYIIRCVALGGTYQGCEIAAQGETCP
jgi:hypothetical protein